MIIDQKKLNWPLWRTGGYVWRDREWEEEGFDDEVSAEPETYLVIPSWWEHRLWGYADDEDLPDAPGSHFPMENKTILKTFVKTEATKEGIMSFAEKFGHLGISRYHRHEGTEPVYGESFGDWAREIAKVRSVIINWGLVNTMHGLNEDAPHVEEAPEDLFEWFDMTCEAMNLLNTAEDGVISYKDPYNLKIIYLSKIKDNINSSLHNRIQPVTEINETVDGISFALAPTTLLGAIWLQIAQVVSPTSHMKVCAYCGDLFEAKSLKAQYCKQSHQQMAHRKRKQMNSAG